MSRYTCHFLVNLSAQNVRFPIEKLFEACEMETIYETIDCLIGREIPGRVVFTKLVTAVVSIEPTNDTSERVRLSLIIKNEELPLNLNNHCREVFDLLQRAIAHNYDWEPINTLRSIPTPSAPELNRTVFAKAEATAMIDVESTQHPIDPNPVTGWIPSLN